MDTREAVYLAIGVFWGQYRFAPTYRELGRLTGLKSASTVKYHLDNLVRDGLIAYDPGKNRTVRIVEKNR